MQKPCQHLRRQQIDFNTEITEGNAKLYPNTILRIPFMSLSVSWHVSSVKNGQTECVHGNIERERERGKERANRSNNKNNNCKTSIRPWNGPDLHSHQLFFVDIMQLMVCVCVFLRRKFFSFIYTWSAKKYIGPFQPRRGRVTKREKLQHKMVIRW